MLVRCQVAKFIDAEVKVHYHASIARFEIVHEFPRRLLYLAENRGRAETCIQGKDYVHRGLLVAKNLDLLFRPVLKDPEVFFCEARNISIVPIADDDRNVY